MLELKMTGMCKDCPHGDIEVSAERFYMYEKAVDCRYVVKCKHEEACKRAHGGSEE